jgi:hypothetical protein
MKWFWRQPAIVRLWIVSGTAAIAIGSVLGAIVQVGPQ